MKKILIVTAISVLVWGCGKVDDTESNEVVENLGKVVQVTEFFDFGCGHCRNTAKTMTKLKKQFGDSLEVTVKHFPLNPGTYRVAEASECAREQGKFQEFHDHVFDNFDKYKKEQIIGYAGDVGLDQAQFSECWSSGRMNSRIQADQKEGRSLGVKGTPFFIINGTTKIPGVLPETSFMNMIEDLLK